MRKDSKKLMALVLAMSLALGTGATVFAENGKNTANNEVATTTATEVVTEEATTEALVIKAKVAKATCTAAGKVNISFKKKVVWDKNPTVVVKNSKGNELKASISRKTKNTAVVKVAGMVKGEKCTVEISGIKDVNSTSEEFGTVTCTFKAKKIKTECKAKKTSVTNKKWIIVKFKGKVAYQEANVTVTNENGEAIEAKIVKKTKGNVKIKTIGLKKGQKYKVVVNGVKLRKEANYGNVTSYIKVK